MKRLSLLIAALALPSSLVFAQTPGGTAQYIPLPGTSGAPGAGGGAASNATAWFIDVATNRVILCSQSGTTGGGGPANQNFTCTAQPIPAATPTPGTPTTPTTPAPGTPTSPGAPS